MPNGHAEEVNPLDAAASDDLPEDLWTHVQHRRKRALRC